MPPFIVVNDRFLAQKKSAAGLLTLATDFCLNVVYKNLRPCGPENSFPARLLQQRHEIILTQCQNIRKPHFHHASAQSFFSSFTI